MFTQHSAPMDPALLDIEGNRHALKYNLLRQKLFLEALMKTGVFFKNDSPNDIAVKQPTGYYSIDENWYTAVFEETPITAFSIGRIIWEKRLEQTYYKGSIERKQTLKLPESMELPCGYIPPRWYVISKDFERSNPFGIRGMQGELVMYFKDLITKELLLLQHNFGQDNKGIGEIQKGKFNIFAKDKTLIIVQGGSMEHAFSLAGSNYDIVFGDVYSKLDYETKANYTNLYNYLQDMCRYESKGGFQDSKVVRKQLCEKSLVKDIIYCKKPSRKYR